MAVETSFRIAVCGVIAGQMPNDQSLVSASRKEHIWAVRCQYRSSIRGLRGAALFERCSQAGNPAAMALKGTTVYELFRHGESYRSGREREEEEGLCGRG